MSNKVTEHLAYWVESYESFKVKVTDECILANEIKCSKVKLIL